MSGAAMTRDEAADAFTTRLAKCDLPLDVKTELLYAAHEWVYAAQREAVTASFAAADRAMTNALDKTFGPPATPTPSPTLTLVKDGE